MVHDVVKHDHICARTLYLTLSQMTNFRIF